MVWGRPWTVSQVNWRGAWLKQLGIEARTGIATQHDLLRYDASFDFG